MCNATLPYVMEIAEKGWLKAIKDNTSLRRGLGFALGYLTFKPTADVQNREYIPPEAIIEMFDK
jgi:alanine dehydrogenase